MHAAADQPVSCPKRWVTIADVTISVRAHAQVRPTIWESDRLTAVGSVMDPATGTYDALGADDEPNGACYSYQ